MSRCKVSKCRASCCYNIPFENNELERFASLIVNPVIGTFPLGGGRVAVTDRRMDRNKCPFLREDCRCNIYESRPEICRMFGEIEPLPCNYMKSNDR